MKKIFGAAVLAGAMAIPMAATTEAQPIAVGNLVNIQIVRLVDDITIRDINVGVAAAANIVANVCDAVDVAALGGVLTQGGTYSCTGTTGNADAVGVTVTR